MVVVRRPISSFGLATGRRRERSPSVIWPAALTTASTGERAARVRRYAPPTDNTKARIPTVARTRPNSPRGRMTEGRGLTASTTRADDVGVFSKLGGGLTGTAETMWFALPEESSALPC